MKKKTFKPEKSPSITYSSREELAKSVLHFARCDFLAALEADADVEEGDQTLNDLDGGQYETILALFNKILGDNIFMDKAKSDIDELTNPDKIG